MTRVVYALFCRVVKGKIVDARDVSDRLAPYQLRYILPMMDPGTGTHTIGGGASSR
jgi:hypothetical protein